MANIIQKLFRDRNTFNKAFYKFIGGLVTSYDHNNTTYLDKGYNVNPDVYSCINQMSTKTASVPYYIKKIKDKKQHNNIIQIKTATKGLNSFIQSMRLKALETKAYEDEELVFPLEKPNPNQTWNEVFHLYKTYLKITGNVYFYLVSPEDGVNAGTPILFYVLPSQLMQIVLKKNADLLSVESPIDYYMLTDGDQYTRFEAKDVIHIKYANPNFDLQGAHLYGMSPLRSALRNINSQNSAIDNNIKTLQNGGSFGFIHGKTTPLDPDQAQSLKDRLVEMDNSPERLGRIAGSSGDIGFTRISLTTDELKPFEYLGYDQKMICNVLGWSTRLLNENNTGTLSGSDITDVLKQVVTNNILPDLRLLQDAFNTQFLPRFKGYENTFIEWDVSELPEMQADIKEMVEWLDKAPITPNEFRTAIKYETLNDDGMDVVWLNSGKKRIDDLSEESFNDANKI